MKPFDAVPYAIPAFILLIIFEMLWVRSRNPTAYQPRDTLTSLALGLGSTAANLLAAGTIATLAVWLSGFRLVSLGWAWWVWIACFVLDDFNYYWAHRTAALSQGEYHGRRF